MLLLLLAFIIKNLDCGWQHEQFVSIQYVTGLDWLNEEGWVTA